MTGDDKNAVYKTVTLTEQELVSGLRNKSKEELRKMGLTAEQVRQIMSCDMKCLKGKLEYSIGYRCFKSVKVREKNSLRKYWVTYITTIARWKWVKQPTCVYSDIFGVTTSDKFVKDEACCTVNYHIAGDRTRGKKTVNVRINTKNAGRGVYAKFPVGIELIPKAGYKWRCTDGIVITRWIADGKVNTVGLASNYGHSVLNLKPSVSFGAGVSISFKPSVSVRYLDEAYTRAKK
ncbi:MAG: hypothetical protein IKS63_01720 [Firmicutes bacterium]|nr:hypothetical protein [Bacillota bacterium]